MASYPVCSSTSVVEFVLLSSSKEELMLLKLNPRAAAIAMPTLQKNSQTHVSLLTIYTNNLVNEICGSWSYVSLIQTDGILEKCTSSGDTYEEDRFFFLVNRTLIPIFCINVHHFVHVGN